jgi:hypothetical protein
VPDSFAFIAIDPDAQVVEVLQLTHEQYHSLDLFVGDDTLPSQIVSDFPIKGRAAFCCILLILSIQGPKYLINHQNCWIAKSVELFYIASLLFITSILMLLTHP